MQKLVDDIMDEAKVLVKSLVEQAGRVRDQRQAEALEQTVRREGQSLLGRMLERLLQQALEGCVEARKCPGCGARRRHKGMRSRGVVSSLGPLRLTGPYWYCPHCRSGQHAAEVLSPGSISVVMKSLLCMLGTSLASFAKASYAAGKLLGVKLDAVTIRNLCLREGRNVLHRPPKPVEVPADSEVTGSCDGTMVNTREDSWRELKAYRYEHPGGVYGGAFLERSDRFLPRLRRAAVAMKAARAKRIFWVSDAAEWIDKGIAKQLPTAIRIVDIWHAYQHVHEASRKIFGEGTAKAKQWGQRYCLELRQYGGWTVWNSLRRVRYKDPERQEGLEALLTFLRRNSDRMDYPTYERACWPISNGSMESFCKQLGQRLKGPGMRWSRKNVDAMASLVTLWSQDRWDECWPSAA